MKMPRLRVSAFFAVILSALPYCGTAQNHQTTYSSGIDRDHYSIVVSGSSAENHVLVGTEQTSPTNRHIHMIEVDPIGNPIWEKRYDASGNNEQAFDITPITGGYAITGMTEVSGADEILVMTTDLNGNITNQRSYASPIASMEIYGLHILKTSSDPSPGFLITGLATAGQTTADNKVGIVMKLTSGLNINWTRQMDSPSTSPTNDFDMNSKALEIPGQGYFISGSANGVGPAGFGSQEAQALMLDYSGSPLWQKNYNFGNGHNWASEGAIYDATTNEIYQMGNISSMHQFYISVFDATTGVRDASRSSFFTSTLGLNIQGFEIIQSNDPANYCIAGFHRSHTWTSTDPGPTSGTSQSGSPAFMVELEKGSNTVVRERQYNIPSVGYTTFEDLFSAFYGQQPIIYTPQMVINKADNSGYVLAAVRKESGATFDLEVVDLANDLGNICNSQPPGFSPTTFYGTDETNTSVINIAPGISTAGLNQTNVLSSTANCQSPEACAPNASFTAITSECSVTFTDNSTGLDLSCYDWDFGDGNTTSGTTNPTHTYAGSGTYTVCLTVCCTSPSGSVSTHTFCQDVTVDCPSNSSCGCDIDNVLINGDFESGGVISSGLAINCACASASVCVGSEPRDKCGNLLWIDDLWDNTIGGPTGHFLIVDGSNGIIWNETVSITAGETYVFSFNQIREVSDNTTGNNSTQTFNLVIDGNVIGSINTAPAPEDEWIEYCLDWTATSSNPSATISIVQTSGTGYNDYGIDDIQFGTCQEPCTVPQLNDYFVYAISNNDCYSHKFDVSSDIAGSEYCYNWYVDGVLVSSDPSFWHTFPADGAYEICLDVFCCTDSTSIVTYCETIKVDCCKIPQLSDYFSYKISNKNCYAHKFYVASEISSGLCYKWYVDGVFVSSSAGFLYTFPADGVYNVCLHVYCCNDPSSVITYCEDIYVNCKKDQCGCVVNDLLKNGDFENTSIPVTSGLPINCNCAGGTVCVGHEPRDKCNNSLWIDNLWDHTTGTSSGNFLIVDGANGVIWSDNVPVTAGKTYIFEFWQIREISDNAANNSTQTFNLVVNGSVIQSFSTAASASDEWTLYCQEWFSTFTSSSITIAIVQTSGSGFNDYGIDDVQFGTCFGSKKAADEDVVESTEKSGDFKLYPNPSSDFITLEFEGDIDATIAEIYSLEGKLIQRIDINERTKLSVDVNDFTDGVYLIQVGSTTQRFVVKN